MRDKLRNYEARYQIMRCYQDICKINNMISGVKDKRAKSKTKILFFFLNTFILFDCVQYARKVSYLVIHGIHDVTFFSAIVAILALIIISGTQKLRAQSHTMHRCIGRFKNECVNCS